MGFKLDLSALLFLTSRRYKYARYFDPSLSFFNPEVEAVDAIAVNLM